MDREGRQYPSHAWAWIASIWLGFGLVDAAQTVFVMRSEGMHHDSLAGEDRGRERSAIEEIPGARQHRTRVSPSPLPGTSRRDSPSV